MTDATKATDDESQLLEHLNVLADTTWIGQGEDTFPTAQGPVVTAYTETMTMGAPFQMLNGDPKTGQKLLCVQYYTQLLNASSGAPMHQETGYWMLSYMDATFRKAVSIPRGIDILAGGTYLLSKEEGLVMIAAAKAGDRIYGILNEPYLSKNAPTQRFTTNMSQTIQTYSYFETSVLNIMGKNFDHTDEAVLTLQS